jgi:cephalosporin hydroxylase
MTDMAKAFRDERAQLLSANGNDAELLSTSAAFVEQAMRKKYIYTFDWLGRPIIQFPQEMVAVQELIWTVKPDLVIETGIAHGGSLILSASMLALLDLCEAKEALQSVDPNKPRRKVLGIDIDIRKHNKDAITAHPLSPYIEMYQGSSIDDTIVGRVTQRAKDFKRVLVFLDSMHTSSHVLSEIEAYSRLVSLGSYIVVFDTIVERLPQDVFPDRPWSPGNSPMTAVDAFLGEHPEFEIDTTWDSKLLVSAVPRGFLRRRS